MDPNRHRERTSEAEVRDAAWSRCRALALAIVPPAGWLLLRLLGRSARFEVVGGEAARSLAGPWILAVWHAQQLMLPYTHRGRRVVGLASRSFDGELIARAIARSGNDTVRGSSSRGGAPAFRQLLAVLRAGRSVAITPDGPRGPAGAVKPGVIRLAARSGCPIVPLAVAARPALRLRSWDRFLVPLPFARVVLRYGEPIRVPKGLCGTEVDEYAEHLAAVLHRLTGDTEQRL